MANNIYRLRRPPTELEKRQMKKAERKQKAVWFSYGLLVGIFLTISIAFLI